MKKVVIISLCFCSILLFCLTGCGKQEEKDIKNKLDSELAYVEDLIFKIANKHAKGEYLEEDEIKWQWIKDDVNRINNSWASLVLDLTDVNARNQDIIEFGNNLNNLLMAVGEENDIVVIEKLSNLYEKIIIFREAYSENKNQIQKNKIKSSVLSIYSQVTKDEWTTAKTQINSIIENYKELMNDASYVEENRYDLNKVYVLLEEYKVSIQTQNYDLVRIKYINVVENL